MTIFDLVFVGPDGWIYTMMCDHQPVTDDMAMYAPWRERYVIQRVGNVCEVYDLRTMKQQRYIGWTVGLPVFVHEDADAAITWAMLNA